MDKKKICLYAGYNRNGKIKDYVIFYLKELEKYCDIYYLADCDMKDDEIKKIIPYVKGAWAKRHGKYDWGSYSELAKNYVGWNIIEKYDELIFANDSNYCVNNFDKVFDKMDKQNCDFWGLISVGKSAPGKVVQNINVKRRLFASDYPFHLCSFFLAYRKNIIMDFDFRKFIDGIEKMKKNHIVKYYEIGGTTFLMDKGYNVKSFIEKFYPTHPVYTKYSIQLLKQGYPLLKVMFVNDNTYECFIDRLNRLLKKIGLEFDIFFIKDNVRKKEIKDFQTSEAYKTTFLHKKILKVFIQNFKDDKKRYCLIDIKILGMRIFKMKLRNKHMVYKINNFYKK